MKLKLQDKLKIIELYEEGHSISTLRKKYNVSSSTIEQIKRQYRDHGLSSFKRKGKQLIIKDAFLKAFPENDEAKSNLENLDLTEIFQDLKKFLMSMILKI